MNKKTMAVSSVVLSSMLFLSACGSSGNQASTTTPSSTATEKTPSSNEKSVELNVAFPIFGAVPKDIIAVQEAINQISLKKINATVKLTPISIGDWQQQNNLMLTSNEKLDLMAVLGNNYSNLVAKNQVLPLSKLLDQQGEGIKKSLDPAYLNAAKVKGDIYAVPTIRDLAANYGILMKKEIVDKYKIDTTKIKTLDDVEAVLKTVKDGNPNFTPLVPSAVGRSFTEEYVPFDNLGDYIGVLPNYDNDLKIVNLYESKDYADFVKKMRSWYSAGYILKDAATNKDSQFDLIKANKGFAYLSKQKPGFEVNETKSVGQPMVAVSLIPPVATTSTVTSIMWGIPRNTKTPEKAMAFLNLMYADKDIINLFDWGIEGKHYVKKSDNVIDYPEGVNSSNSGYNLNMGWLFGNQFLSYVFNGDEPNLWKNMDEFNKSAKKSKALGFIFDVTPIKTEYAAVTNVVKQYKLPLETGSVDPDTVLPDFIAKLKSAGMDKIIAEKQKQLDEWAKSNK
ncbi:ABC transporter substrate-binding protein [Paenibacillus whitsoniae]|uniref:Extracellular solute-binding protein n=1 Tax=Paenibacillus whitsoniae TaxID=2496558 RepID=A0A3S0BP01_9BACL|nr:ABC transporter substrate-binding protein [Paenibacillus whitsoniae]RTE10877.1 extracellular solute-binding protein [Paenibacillus whitsoniae]